MNIESITESQSHSHSDISPEVLLSCSMFYALAVSLSDSLYALILASVIPVLLAITKRLKLSSLVKINVFNLIMIITLALTWPNLKDGFSYDLPVRLCENICGYELVKHP